MAGPYSKWADATLADIARMLGTKQGPEARAKHAALPKYDGPHVAVPDSFNTVTNWPMCANVSGLIRDQSDCGSCW